MNKRLREIRLNHKISQNKMAEILGLSQSQTSYLELNDVNTTSEVIENFYKYFGIEETIYLISGEKINNNELSENEKKILEQYNLLSDINKGQTINFINERLKEQNKENDKDLKNIG